MISFRGSRNTRVFRGLGSGGIPRDVPGDVPGGDGGTRVARRAAGGGAGRPCSGEGDRRRRRVGGFVRREALLAPVLCVLTLAQLPCIAARLVVHEPTRVNMAAYHGQADATQCAGAIDCIELLVEYLNYLLGGDPIDPEVKEACFGDDDPELGSA